MKQLEELLVKLKSYDFSCEAGPLEKCVDFLELVDHARRNYHWYCENCDQSWACPPDKFCSRAACPRCGNWMLNYWEYRAEKMSKVLHWYKDAELRAIKNHESIDLCAFSLMVASVMCDDLP